MPQPSSPILKCLHLAEHDLEIFKKTIDESREGIIPQKQIDKFFKDLGKHLKQLEGETSKKKADFEAKVMKEFEHLEAMISLLQNNSVAKNCKGNIGNMQMALGDFLTGVRQQVSNVKKKKHSIDPVANVDYDQL